ncbi:hypothetical protein H4R18_001709 [Coemansia javaensis]|uniref:Uncharacterized protein n=1 Tax=Coemansia javaensis TaxID=2761396 RepID=A0A9W8HHB9_9FUNG|nr:hypothetical protein H4R18_001709 [Coemansia javaensis]
MQAQEIADAVFCGISLACSVTQCLLITYLVRRKRWVFSMFLQLSLAMALVVTANRCISYLDIFFKQLPAHVRRNQVYVRVMYGFLDISFLPFAYFFLITAFCIDLMLNFALRYRSGRWLHQWYIPTALFLAGVISLPILAWPGELGANHLYIVSGSWAQRHYHIITLSIVIVICTLASVALVGAGFWRTIHEWRSLRREIDELVLPIASDDANSRSSLAGDSPGCGGGGMRRASSGPLPLPLPLPPPPHSPDSLDRLYYGRKVSRSIYYLAMYPIINLVAHLATGVGQISVYAYPNQKWSRSVRDFSNDCVGILLLIVFISNPAFVELQLRRIWRRRSRHQNTPLR